MTRFEIINKLIVKHNFKSYLEIGVRDIDDCFDKIVCPIKNSVDPCHELINNFAEYKYTSDTFFTLLDNNEITHIRTNYKVVDVDWLDASKVNYIKIII